MNAWDNHLIGAIIGSVPYIKPLVAIAVTHSFFARIVQEYTIAKTIAYYVGKIFRYFKNSLKDINSHVTLLHRVETRPPRRHRAQ